MNQPRYWLTGILACLWVFLSATLPHITQPSLAQKGIIDEPALTTETVDGRSDTSTPPAASPDIADRQALEDFVDEFMASTSSSQDPFPGAAVAVVQGGETLLAKGYGYADLDKKVPVDAETTLFRVASLSKLFTATATLQLQEQGLLDIHDDIQPYLGESIDLQNPYAEPVTFARMMMHTEGSTKRRIGLAARTQDAMQPLEDYLGDYLPPIIRPPGEIYSYSSHTIALLGYLVQKIAQQPFPQYIDEHILQPLQMERSSFLQPPPAGEVATGYQQNRQGEFQPVPYLYLNIGPAAALSATATEMAHFMSAHLQGGAYGDSRILQPESVAAMHATHYQPRPQLPGTGYGFRERWVNGLRVIGHLGSLRGYSSSLSLIPDANVGVFIVSNSFGGIHSRFLSQFFDRYFPRQDSARSRPEAVPASDRASLDLEALAGVYWDVEYPHHTLTKLSGLFQHIHVQATQTGLRITSPGLFFRKQRQPVELIPLQEPDLFRRDGQQALTAFERNQSGQVKYVYNPIAPKINTYRKVSWFNYVWVQGGLWLGVLLLLLSACWIWPLRPLMRWLRSRPRERSQAAQPSPAWIVAGITGGLNGLFVIGLPLSLWLYGPWKLAYGLPLFVKGWLLLPMVTAGLAAVMVAIALRTWLPVKGTAPSPLHYTLVTLAALGFTGLAAYWNLLQVYLPVI